MTRFRIPTINPQNICTVAKPAVKYSICTLVTSETEYRNMRRSFELAGFSPADTEYLYADNILTNSLDAYTAFRKFSSYAKGEYIIYCHQDVLALDKINVLDDKIKELDQLDPFWAIAGNAGASTIKSFFKYFVNGDNENEFVGDLPAKVSSLDEDFLVIKREAGLSTSADLSGYHFYATDLCINADILGYSSYVIKYLVQHKSAGSMVDVFWASRDLFIHKYTRALRSRVLQTTCIKLVIAGNRIISYLANKSPALFVIKELAKIKRKFSLKS